MSTSGKKQVLVIRLSSLGDIILTEPIVRLLKEKDDVEITFLTKTQFLPLLELIPNIDHPLGLPTDTQPREVLQQLKDEIFAEVYDLQRNWRSRAARRAAGGHSHLAHKEWWKRTAAVRFKRLHTRPHHAVERYLTALALHDVTPTRMAPELQLPREYKDWWQEGNSCDLFESAYYVLGAGAAHATKRAPLELWRKVNDAVLDRYGVRPLLLGAPSERDVLLKYAEGLGLGEELVITESPIGRAAAVVAGAKFVLSNDSGLAHLAAGLGRPVLALFGPTHPVLGFSPLGPTADFYTTNVFCSPCSRHGKRPCFRDQRYCFNEMDVETILTKLDRLIAG